MRVGPDWFGARTRTLLRGARLPTRGTTYGVAPVVNGLDFPLNETAGSDVALEWTGANMVPRIGHTVVWKVRHVQQTGYYATIWHTQASGFAGLYEYGTHPYPADGAVDGTGQATGGTGSFGTVHYWEIAGVGGSRDKLASPGGTALLVTKGVWYSQARTCELVSGGTIVRHTYWPDIEGNPSYSIVHDMTPSEFTGMPTMKFLVGASPWRANTPTSGRNDETVGGVLRHLMIYDAALSLVDIQAKLARTSDDTTANDSRCWYSNLNPTPSDVTDKSGAGHSPSWANANRPTLYTG